MVLSIAVQFTEERFCLDCRLQLVIAQLALQVNCSVFYSYEHFASSSAILLLFSFSNERLLGLLSEFCPYICAPLL